MALVLKDRVRESSSTSGTGTITLAGAATGFDSFASIGDGNTTYYAIIDTIAGEWEVGLGTYTASGTTLSRDTVLESSNSDTLVNFAANTKDVICTYPADKSVFLSADGSLSLPGALSATGAVTGSNLNVSNWDTAYGWGDHSTVGYLTSYTETDPVYTASTWYTTTNNASNWDTAYGWGDHASAGYYSASGGTISGDVTVTGTLNVRTAIDLEDNDILRFGTGDDCELFCNGSSMYMDLNSGIANFYIRDGTTVIYTFNDNGSFTATGDVTAYSDERLKENWKDLPEGFVANLAGVKSGTYNRIDLDGKKQVGVSAQSLQTLLPDAVIESGDTLAVNYGNAALASAIELAKKVVELEARIKELEGK